VTGFAQAVDDGFLIDERSLAQFAERREKSGVARRLRVRWRNTPQADQQENREVLPGTPEMLDY
jgi:hypothetical protein